MTKREAESSEYRWESSEEADSEDAGDLPAGSAPAGARPGFHLQAARKIEEARERRQLRKAIEDFDDYDV